MAFIKRYRQEVLITLYYYHTRGARQINQKNHKRRFPQRWKSEKAKQRGSSKWKKTRSE